eukprot:XP_011683346.1 PREDICTED: uncharacterized protein LOC105447228 [Strongylocentrotus purpuratus]
MNHGFENDMYDTVYDYDDDLVDDHTDKDHGRSNMDLSVVYNDIARELNDPNTTSSSSSSSSSSTSTPMASTTVPRTMFTVLSTVSEPLSDRTTIGTTELDGETTVGAVSRSLPNYMLIIVISGAATIAVLTAILCVTILVKPTRRKKILAVNMRNAKHSDPVPCQVELRTSSYIDPDRLDQDDSLDQDHLSHSYRVSDEFSMDDSSQVVNRGGATDNDDEMIFLITFIIYQFNGAPAIFANTYLNPESSQFQIGSSAIAYVLPRVLQARGVTGIVDASIGRFYQGSLGVEVMLSADDNFQGNGTTVTSAITEEGENNDEHLAVDGEDVQIGLRSLTVAEIMDYDECENATLNDCSMDASCRDISGVGFNCTCNGGFIDLYPSSLPGRYCRAVPGDSLNVGLIAGLTATVAFLLLFVLVMAYMIILRLRRRKYSHNIQRFMRNHSNTGYFSRSEEPDELQMTYRDGRSHSEFDHHEPSMPDPVHDIDTMNHGFENDMYDTVYDYDDDFVDDHTDEDHGQSNMDLSVVYNDIAHELHDRNYDE